MDSARGASFHASEAIRYDSLGAAGMAIHHYGEGTCAPGMLLAAHPRHVSPPAYELYTTFLTTDSHAWFEIFNL